MKTSRRRFIELKLSPTFFTQLGEVSLILYTIFFLLFVWMVFRVGFFFYFRDEIFRESQWVLLFPYALRFDVLTISYLFGVPFLCLLLTPYQFSSQYLAPIFRYVISGIMFFIIFLEGLTLNFLKEYGKRPDQLGIEYLKYPKEIFGMIFTSYKFEFFSALSIGLFLSFVFFYGFKKIENMFTKIGWQKKIISFLFFSFFFILGGRSSFGHRPANISTASFSNVPIINELVLNSFYTTLYDLYRMKHEGNPFDIYPSLSRKSIFSIVKKFSLKDGKHFIGLDPESIINSYPSVLPQKGKYKNIVIILEESLGSDFVGRQGGTKLTPHIDQLSKQGLFFNNLYATGTRTVRGLEATLTGFLPTPGRSVIKLPKANKDFFTVGRLLHKLNYHNFFFYGGDSNFDEMKTFFINNGFDQIIDQHEFSKKIPRGSWGVHDEDLLIEGHKKLNAFSLKSGRPFLAVFLTTSNHSPFDYPKNKIQVDSQYSPSSHQNAIKYADHALGRFFAQAKDGHYFNDTIFLVVADHNTRVYGHDLVPIHKFKIPGLILGPGVPKKTYEKICSNLDLLPTLLHLANVNLPSPILGRDLLALNKNEPGRAIMQYGKTYAFMSDEKVAIIKPFSPVRNFFYREGHLIEKSAIMEFSDLALAHALIPWFLYSERKYH